jgi:hypothetical protein
MTTQEGAYDYPLFNLDNMLELIESQFPGMSITENALLNLHDAFIGVILSGCINAESEQRNDIYAEDFPLDADELGFDIEDLN